MALSKRRLQFLDQLVDMYQQSRLPVHYEALAKVLGVSKWTAYDMLKAIEKAGFVTRSYETNPNVTGRSQVVFTPTEKATELLGKEETLHQDGEPEEAQVRLQLIRDMLSGLKDASAQDLITKLLIQIPEKHSNFEICGYISGILVIYTNQLESRMNTLIRKLVQETDGDQPRLLIFIGTVVGTIIQMMSKDVGQDLMVLVGSYTNRIHALSQAEQTLLADFILEALA
ncbi:Lrp/AsnC family transcriptional regulator [Paenibacillus barcinonensis]|uniref:Heat-inducible transcription repressor HrcA n=1 Tax=Paenibacillus barcinonensis TaxID=198119 RepID=A0A2V4V7T7_PAEBA|nr:Lrp/AsnC family transcriptional regulator [Paenibacillus barcinonensis]PYE47891.1 heat-inducible transcription repressor HrcA [Paenibacillus barcinonensis]QKS59026.1 Lrp/AsnC family transcriptional regulator [Paenibacillus barcinonensis]